tara:strand:- start:853 stop:1422 length:570 start_codon:yes stop_codon:yes gene_type:complete
MDITHKLLAIQLELKAPKKQRNSFGNYNYRSAEDILEAIKPYAGKYGVLFKITEEIRTLNDYVYIQSIAACIDVDSQQSIESVGFAIVDFQAKGMQMPQRTGSASSYAKKYALGNLLLLDDTKDADATNTHNKKPKAIAKPKPTTKEELTPKSSNWDKVKAYLNDGGDIKKVMEKYTISENNLTLLISK